MKKLFLFFILVILSATLYPLDVLVVEFNGKSCYLILDHNFTLSVEYIHSVSHTKVVDVYMVDDTGIRAVEERWQQFDAGQPLDVQCVRDGFFIKKLNVSLGKSWQYWFIPLNRAKVLVDGNIVFVQPAEEGVLKLEVKQIPVILYYWQGVLSHA